MSFSCWPSIRHHILARDGVSRRHFHRASAQQEFPQHFPASGWVEHEPEDIWTSTVMVCRDALEEAGLTAKDIAAIGNHQPARDHRGVGPRHRPGRAPRHRLAGPPHRRRLRETQGEGHEPAIQATLYRK